MVMNISAIAYIVVDVILFLAYLAGIVTGIILLVRKVKLPGILTIVGFSFLALNTIFSLVFGNFIIPAVATNSESIMIFYAVNSCVQGILTFIGISGLIAALFTGLMPKKQTEGI